MSDIAIRVENLSKKYKIGRAQQRHDTLRDALVDVGSRLGDRFRRTGANGHANDETIWALKDVSFEVKRGEVVGIIGRNGAGKSTLLKILSQITEPTSGRAEIHGRVGSLLEVGTGFHPELTGRENIFLNGAILGMRREEIQRQFDEIVAFAEIEKFLDTPVKRYSSGMYVRLAFAVAAHLEPEILLVDEVLAVGDAAFQKKCLGKMGDVARDGRTVFFVSHNMNAVQRLCSRALMLQRGLVGSEGSVESTIRHYLKWTSAQLATVGSSVDLINAERTGNRSVEFRSVRTAGTGDFGEVVSQGAMEVELEIWSDKERSVGSIAIYLSELHGTKLINADTVSQGVIIPLKPGGNSLRFLIDAVQLVPGTYTLGLWLAQPQGTEVFDHIAEAIRVDIVEGENKKQLGIQADALVPCGFQVELL